MACVLVLRQGVISTYIGSGYPFVLWCSFLLLNTIINPYYHSCVFMTDFNLTISLSTHNGDDTPQNHISDIQNTICVPHKTAHVSQEPIGCRS